MNKNQTKGIVKINASGVVTIFKEKYNKAEKLITSSNNVLPLITDLIARSLGNFTISTVDIIKVFRSGLEVASGAITNYAHPDTNQVSYQAIFDEASFSGTFDELGLYSSSMGRIATLAALSETKASDEIISVTWTLTITTCP